MSGYEKAEAGETAVEFVERLVEDVALTPHQRAVHIVAELAERNLKHGSDGVRAVGHYWVRGPERPLGARAVERGRLVPHQRAWTAPQQHYARD